MNLENVRVMLEQCRKGTEVMSTIVNLEQKLQHRILIFFMAMVVGKKQS